MSCGAPDPSSAGKGVGRMHREALRNELKQLMRGIEGMLGSFYHLALSETAAEYLLTEGELSCLTLEQQRWVADRRAALLAVIPAGQGEMFLSLYLSDGIIERLCVASPLDQLTLDNLDAFCVLVEELSHFHLLTSRARQRLPLRILEMEVQGEIDKVLVSALCLAAQSGDHQLRELLYLLCGASRTYRDEDRGLYLEATKWALRLWQHLLEDACGSRDPARSAFIRAALCQLYHASWPQKVALIEDRKYG